MSDRFNKYVSMDLNEVEKVMVRILYLTDAAARYADACLIRRKKELVVCRIFQIWVA